MNFDTSIFHLINNLAQIHSGVDAIGIFAALFLLPLLGVLTILAAFTVKRLREEHWYELPLKVFLAGALAYGVRTVIGVLVQRPRPFLGLSDMHLLVSRESSYSFPSGHAAVAFALAFVMYRHDRDWGIAFLILALLVAVGRVFVGVHYPMDIIGGAVVGWGAARAVDWFDKREWVKITRTLRAR